MNSTAVLITVVLAAAASAQERQQPLAIPHAPFHGVFVADAEPDGSVWVRGDRYKLGLAAGAATFQPLFGPKAARDWPIRLELAGCSVGAGNVPLAAGVWQREADHFVCDRGAVSECWRATAGAAQQYFVVDRPAATGALVLRIACTTDLVRVDDGPGVRFVQPGLGEVTYSDAVVIDARGERLEVPVGFAGDALSIAVPAAFVAGAAWPIVIDPLLTTFAVDTTVSDVQDARVACDPASGLWLVVAEEHLSATDADIVCKRYDSSAQPVLLDTTYAANGPELTHNPDVCSVAQPQRFFVAWHNTSTSNGSFQFRTRSATSTTQTAVVTTSAGLGGDLSNRPRLGGSRSGQQCLLVMFRRNSSGNDILAVRLSGTGVNLGTLFVGPIPSPATTVIAHGDVSTIQDDSDSWVVVWRECTSANCNAMRVRMQALSAAGPGLPAQAAIDLANGSLEDEPSVGGWGGNLLAAWRHFGTSNDIRGVVIGVTGGTWGPIGAVQNLSQQEPNVLPQREQLRPAVSFDGCRFVYGYLEDNGNDSVFPFAATVLVTGSTIAWHEGHLALSAGTDTARSLDVAHGSAALPDFGHHLAVWQEDSPTFTGNIGAASIDARIAGGTTAVHQTGCGAPNEPGITITGTPAIGRTFRIDVQAPGGLPFVLAGTQQTTPLPGCGTCAAGVVQSSMVAFFGSSLSVSVPATSGMLGLQLAFQGLVMLQPGGCPAAVFGVDFAVTDTIDTRAL